MNVTCCQSSSLIRKSGLWLLPLLVIIALQVLLFLAVAAAVTGCASTPAGLQRERSIYGVATNMVADVQQFVPYLPAPVQVPVEALLAAATAGLTAWSTHQQMAIAKLKKAVNGNGSSKACPTPSPPSLA